ncbi:MAG: S24/S26 family peptidase [Candidatus Woesearchaeota archaeon]
MVIYDKNQFTFNVIFLFILLASISLNIYYSKNFYDLKEKFIFINQSLQKIESNQNFNFIEGSHYELEYYLTPQGFYVLANDYGLFSGPSMQPSIFDGNTLIEKKYSGEKIKPGQIVRFVRDNGQAVIHRVRADYGNSVYVQGDSLKEGEIIEKSKITHLVVGVLYT